MDFVECFFNDYGNGGKNVVRAIAAPFYQQHSQNMFSEYTKSKGAKISDEEIVNILRSCGYSGEVNKTLTN